MSDTISRQVAIDAVNKIAPVNTEYDCRLLDILDVRYVLTELPSAKPERKKGKWLELTNTNHTYMCSVCGRMLVNITDGKNTVTKNYPFCHCGADMRGEQE